MFLTDRPPHQEFSLSSVLSHSLGPTVRIENMGTFKVLQLFVGHCVFRLF